jgi:2-methylcitrate dehydratase PrpD
MSNGETTETVAEFISKRSIDAIPDNAIDISKNHIMDCTGVTVAGSRDPTGKIIIDFVKKMGGECKASVICGGCKTSAAQAAFANATMAHAIDYDDDCDSILGYSSAVLLPAILALGEEFGSSGRDVIEAYILGLEVEAKIGSMINVGHYAQGWHATSTLGKLGSAAACAKLLGLDVEGIRIAMGLAASSSGGIRQNFGTMAKRFHAGHAARGGVIAALLAKQGFTADRRVLEAPFGF